MKCDRRYDTVNPECITKCKRSEFDWDCKEVCRDDRCHSCDRSKFFEQCPGHPDDSLSCCYDRCNLIHDNDKEILEVCKSVCTEKYNNVVSEDFINFEKSSDVLLFSRTRLELFLILGQLFSIIVFLNVIPFLQRYTPIYTKIIVIVLFYIFLYMMLYYVL
jgi:hypothetical protein